MNKLDANADLDKLILSLKLLVLLIAALMVFVRHQEPHRERHHQPNRWLKNLM
jgi:hypothetical protein